MNSLISPHNVAIQFLLSTELEKFAGTQLKNLRNHDQIPTIAKLVTITA